MRLQMMMFISLLFIASVSGQSFVCMSGNPRCGTCTNDLDSCQHDTTCEFSMFVLEGFEVDTPEQCQAYVQAGNQMQPDVTQTQIADEYNGVPALTYGMTMAIYPDTTGIDKLSTIERYARLKNNSLTNATYLPPCSKEALLSIAQYSDDFQKCFNNYLYTKGEAKLEQAACDYMTEGAGATFCSSKLFQGVTGAFNKVLNHYVQGPVTKAMSTVENCASSAVHSIASGFFHLFR